MIKEVRKIIQKDLNKYQTLVNNTEGENQKIYLEVAKCLENILEEK